MTDYSPMEVAYGLLWHCPIDMDTIHGRRTYEARQLLRMQIGKDGQKRGIEAASQLVPDEDKSHPLHPEWGWIND